MSDNITEEQVKQFVVAGHMNLMRVKTMLAENPELLNMAYEWAEGDRETALMAAAHVGNRMIAQYLLNEGAPLDICTAAMMGRREDVARFIEEDPAAVHARGAHGITLLFHAALSGDPDMLQFIVDRGGGQEGRSHAVHAAVMRRSLPVLRWLLERGVDDVNMADYEGKTPLDRALAAMQDEMAALLREHGGVETAAAAAAEPEDETQRNIRMEVERLYETEGLADPLVDPDAELLLRWAEARIPAMVARGGDLDEKSRYLHRLVRRISHYAAARETLDPGAAAEQMAQIAEAAAGLGYPVQGEALRAFAEGAAGRGLTDFLRGLLELIDLN